MRLGAPVPTGDDDGRGIAALVENGGHTALVVDFDETLWLRNSTETYLGSLRPRSLAIALLAVLNVLRPWAFLPGPRKDFVYRDWVRVLTLSVLMPWGLLSWRRKAVALGRRHANDDLLAAMGEGRLDVVTFGFRPVVAPLLSAVTSRARLTVAGGLLTGFRIRAAGKRACVERELGADVVAGSLVVTDSPDDDDLLRACRTPVLVRWPGSHFEPAFSDAYLPFLYTSKGKRPGQRYLLHHVLLEDVLLLWLAVAWTMPSPVLGALALLFLHGAFWLVYEIGYHENDHLAVLREENPVVPAGAAAFGHRMHPRSAWACALLLSLPGIGLLALVEPVPVRWLGARSGWDALLYVSAAWVGYLLLSRAVYWLYNRIDVKARGYWYLALQLSRSLGYSLLLLTSVVGAALLCALAIARWVPYLSYREVGRHWESSYRVFLLVVFALLLLTAAAGGQGPLLTWQAAVAAAWLLARASRKRHEVITPGRRLLNLRPPP